MVHATTVSKWGNSEAVRIPRDILRAIGLRAGDKVKMSTTPQGGIHIMPECKEHRRVKPDPTITYEVLFGGYEPPTSLQGDPWASDDMVCAEWEAWS